jgi:protein-L-isoaspartate(D-aspartate) O-methyltransferase
MSAQAAPAYEEDEETNVQAAAIVLKLRGLGISDRAVLKAIETVPRSPFVPEKWRHHAYSDHALPIECGQTISAPSVVGLTTVALDVSDRHAVLEIGAGSGYQSAILAKLARRVTAIDRFRKLVKAAEQRWQALGVGNISGIVADGALGWSRQAPFDRILVSAACEAPPVKLIAQLSDSGILIAPIGGGTGPQRLTLFQRIGKSVDTRDLGPVQFLPLVSGVAQNL